MNFTRLINTIGLNLRRGSVARGRYLRKRGIFAETGRYFKYQPRLVPLYPELIRIHNNVFIAAGVRLITHDTAHAVLNKLGKGRFPERVGCIEIMDNVFIGYNCTILPDVKIGENVIVGACSTVTRDLAPNSVYAGTPAKRVGSFDDFIAKRLPKADNTFDYSYVRRNQYVSEEEMRRAWSLFNAARENL